MKTLFQTAKTVLDAATARRDIKIACAESCTGGLIASALTDVPGASAFFAGGLVAYSVETKQCVLGVPAATIEQHGVVSAECAEAMAREAARLFGANRAIATTGVAGPGDQDGIPAGTVYIALASSCAVISEKLYFPNEPRERVKSLAAQAALRLLHENL